MPRLTVDPNTETMPDYADPDLAEAFQARLQDGETIEGLIQGLKDTWTAKHLARVDQWNEQQREDQEQRQQQELERQQQEETARREEEERVATARGAELQRATDARHNDTSATQDRREKPDDKERKPKFKAMASGKTVGTVYTPRPSSYALNKLKNGDYVELFYFSPEGCTQAAAEERTSAHDALAATQINDQLVLQPMAAYKPSSKVLKDADLDWRQVQVAKTSMLKHMETEGWDKDLVLALTTFYFELDNHLIRQREQGDEAITQYQAEVRRQWIDELKSTGDEPAFDIGVINEARLENIYSRRQSERQLATVKA